LSGLNRLAFLLALSLASTLSAQALPDIGEAELEDVKLLLLDDAKVARGMLTAKSARKARDGKITVTEAALTYARKDGTLSLKASKLHYSPGAGEFEAPSGFEAQLPDGGVLSVPRGNASVSTNQTLELKATCSGEVRLRIGPEAKSPLDSKITDPNVALSFDDNGKTRALRASGTKGATLKAAFSRLPSLGGSASAAQLMLACNSAVSFEMSASEATLRLNGRVRGRVEQKLRTFTVSCSTLRLRALLSGANFEPAELEAEGGARVEAEDLSASAGHVLLVETVVSRTATLTRDARARTWPEGQFLELQAQDYAILRADVQGQADGSLELELKGSAQLLALGGKLDSKGRNIADWLVQGQHIRCTRRALGFFPEQSGAHYRFEVQGQGFAPLLSLAAKSESEGRSLTLFGKGAEGSLWVQPAGSALGDVTVSGPDIFADVLGPFHLVRDLRKALGLRPLEDAANAPEDPGRVVIRAQQSVRLNFASVGGQAQSLMAYARGSVEVRQEPVKRDDRELCSLAGASVMLDINAARIGSAAIEPSAGEVRATIGFDLLRCARFQISSQSERQVATLTAPGRAILRDAETLAYLHGALSHLKLDSTAAKPDAGWIVFAHTSTVTHASDHQLFAFHEARLVFVRGDFSAPRAGQGAFDDLDELEDSDVSLLYEARGRELLGEVQLSGEAARQMLRLNLTLTGSPLLRSEGDGLLARATGPITIEANEISLRDAEGKRQRYLTGSTLRLGENADVRFENAARYFDESGRLGGFSYGGTWTLRGAASLEFSFLPPGIALQALQRQMGALGRATPDWGVFLDRLAAFEAALGMLDIPALSSLDQMRAHTIAALLREARSALRHATEFAVIGEEALAARLRDAAQGCEARALALLGPSYLIVSAGFTEIELRSDGGDAAPMLMSMASLEIRFSALAEVMVLRGAGPVRISRGRYAVSGKLLQRREDGALTLDGARLTLPAEVGIEVEGATTLTVRAFASADGRVRVSGRQLNFKATLFKPAERK
jgi:hypothetical protein